MGFHLPKGMFGRAAIVWIVAAGVPALVWILGSEEHATSVAERIGSTLGLQSGNSRSPASATPGAASSGVVHPESAAPGATSLFGGIELISEDDVRSASLNELAAATPEDQALLGELMAELENPVPGAPSREEALARISSPAAADLQGLRRLQVEVWTLVASSDPTEHLGEILVEAVIRQESPRARRTIYDEFSKIYPDELDLFYQRLLDAGMDDTQLGIVDLAGEALPDPQSAEDLATESVSQCTRGPLLTGCDSNWQSVSRVVVSELLLRERASLISPRPFAEVPGTERAVAAPQANETTTTLRPAPRTVPSVISTPRPSHSPSVFPSPSHSPSYSRR